MTHIDELPQLFNILCGQMSLIGPRPERKVYADELEDMEPLYRYRFGVKPGLTGWTQVKFGYGETKHDELLKLRFDLHYIKNQSVRFDMLIILKTVVEMVGCSGR
jgi:lipopolysaccharide/colanic/teichoic acid biosynthesis glycosyltransferase